MLVSGRGILPLSEHFSLTPSPVSRRLLYFCESAGSFACGPEYSVERGDFGSYLLIAVKAGTLYIGSDEKPKRAVRGDVILLDCHKPHRYFVREACSFAFAHIDGANTRDFYEAFLSAAGGVSSGYAFDRASEFLDRVCMDARVGGRQTEYERSLQIHSVLCSLVEGVSGRGSGALDAAQSYLAANLSRSVSVADAARAAGLSEAHFSRQFRRRTGLSPHQYLLRLRVDRAKECLREPDGSVKRAAFDCGFSSESNFIAAFSRLVGMTPGEYRNTPL